MSGDLFWVGIFILLFGLVVFLIGFLGFKRKRLIENLPTSKVRSIAMGLVELYGKVKKSASGTIKSPLLGKDCVYYDCRIEEFRSNGKSSSWVNVKSDRKTTYFFLEDNTGKVLVDPALADVDVPQNFSFESGFGRAPPASIKSFLKSNNLAFESFLGFNKQMRFTERILCPDTQVYVLGEAMDNPFVKDGSYKKGVIDVMISIGKDSLFYISDKHEKDLIKKFSTQAYIGIIGGSFAIVAGATIIFIYLGLF